MLLLLKNGPPRDIFAGTFEVAGILPELEQQNSNKLESFCERMNISAYYKKCQDMRKKIDNYIDNLIAKQKPYQEYLEYEGCSTEEIRQTLLTRVKDDDGLRFLYDHYLYLVN